LFVLCGYLLVLVPANFAILASRSLPSLRFRGAAAALEFIFEALVTLACVTAGWMLRAGNPGGRPVAVVALTLQALASIQSLHASALPHDVQPGLVLPLTVLALLNAGVWIIYLYSSERLRVWLEI
jgi:hypothetical protein